MSARVNPFSEKGSTAALIQPKEWTLVPYGPGERPPAGKQDPPLQRPVRGLRLSLTSPTSPCQSPSLLLDNCIVRMYVVQKQREDTGRLPAVPPPELPRLL
ncbi:Hypothetical protein SMAX5B_016646 [Scophthalmus maximus]|uniref:Uncharacterized protein n=1 Tax=Scophthalmus maximus TaxID=52904 RepID=A0A2U9B1R5_SCOMX|nr:Hypothetical protein SMAX5B_016646 [Scophthalmus maximus]